MVINPTLSTKERVRMRWATVRLYVSLTKPRMVMINVLMVIVGGYVAHGSWATVLWAALGSSLVIASACVVNNRLDRDYDAQMTRTMARAIPRGKVSVRAAEIFAAVLGLVGHGLLWMMVHWLPMVIALIGYVSYVVVYTAWLKRTSTWSTSIGGIAGAIPPVIGYSAVTETIDWVAVLLFAVMFFWQPPHFWALAIYKREEYAQAGYPLLPVVKGVARTKKQMIPYVVAMFPVLFALTVYDVAGKVFFIGSWFLVGFWLWLCVRGFMVRDELRWALMTFRYSLVVLVGMMVLLVSDRL